MSWSPRMLAAIEAAVPVHPPGADVATIQAQFLNVSFFTTHGVLKALLADGRVMCRGEGVSARWWRAAPADQVKAAA